CWPRPRIRIELTAAVHQREPLDLNQVDDYSCLTCVVANILYVLRVTDNPDPQWVDREVGREPGCGAERAEARRVLLRQDLCLHTVCSYQPDQFLREGLEYLRCYYHQEWDPSWEEHWTPHRLEQHRRECLAMQELSIAGMHTEHRRPTFADLHDALDRGRLVWISVDNDLGEVDCHAVLVYGCRGDVFDVYSPEISGRCLQRYRCGQLAREWLRSEGMTAIWAPNREACMP
ncbi:MAG: hypothetical protein ACRDSH_15930, partial [Pseudonocardiaceae bacterium]